MDKKASCDDLPREKIDVFEWFFVRYESSQLTQILCALARGAAGVHRTFHTMHFNPIYKRFNRTNSHLLVAMTIISYHFETENGV
jgi:hypothetical protein